MTIKSWGYLSFTVRIETPLEKVSVVGENQKLHGEYAIKVCLIANMGVRIL